MILSLNTKLTRIKKAGLLILAGLLLSCGQESRPRVIIETGRGNITLEIYTDEAPVSANNFLSLVDRGRYDQAVFYRVVRMDNQARNKVKIEVIQGGLFSDEFIDVHPAIAHETTEETGILHRNGVISMARMEPGTASTEFFICIGDQPSLDYQGDRNPDGQGFAAFGKVIQGMDVVHAIQALPDQGQYLPEQVVIRSITRVP